MEAASDEEPVHVVSTPTPRRRRKKSFVWNYFTVEAVDDGCTRACCKQCKQTYAYSTGSKIAGTSHLKRHILMGICPKIRQEQRQLTVTPPTAEGSTDPLKRRYRTSSSSSFLHAFDQERSCLDLAKMIILHEYSLNMVEHPAFLTFVQGLQPRFKVPDLNSIQGEVMAVYQKEKHNLSVLFENVPGRVSLAIGLWSTSQTLGYVCLTGHFIDKDWKLHKRMMNFMMVSSPHSENALSDAIGFSLSDWNMKSKLFTITLDNNCSSHDIYSANLRDHLSYKNTLILKGQLFVVRCYAHVLNLVAQDVLASIHGIVYNIRETVKYVKASLAREENFVEIARQLQIPSIRTLSLDVQMQWNTTYLMLVAALDFRHAFTYLETCDPNYNEAPSSDDWRKVEIVCTYLKLLYDSANVITGSTQPTSNIYFHEAWKIQLELANATFNHDPIVCSIASEMHEKFDKYWKDCCLILAVAVVMDPRFKMKLVEFSFSKIYGQDAARYIKMVDDAIHELYQEYVASPLPLTPAYIPQQEEGNFAVANNVDVHGTNISSIDAIEIDDSMAIVSENEGMAIVDMKDDMAIIHVEAKDAIVIAEANNDVKVNIDRINGEASDTRALVEVNNPEAIAIETKDLQNGVKNTGNSRTPSSLSTGDNLLDFDIYISEMAVHNQTKSEIDQYLEESLVPRIQEFDILNWWRLNILKYPTLCKMARDVLSIPMSMLSSFSSGSGNGLLDDYRSSLRPEIVEALFCTRDWLQHAPPMTETAPPAPLKMEF